MITGRVTTDEKAIIRLVVSGPDGAAQDLEVLLDTGFNGYLKLPGAAIAALALRYQRDAVVMLADDTVIVMLQYEGRGDWDGEAREVLVLEAEGVPLAGMSLLRGSRVTLNVVDGGAVTIEPLA
jgi:predicted aspartyl protease